MTIDPRSQIAQAGRRFGSPAAAWLALTGVVVGAAAISAPIGAQAPSRIATTVETLKAYPVFFHGKQVVIRSSIRRTDSLTQLVPDEPSDSNTHKSNPVFVFWREQSTRNEGEVRGEFWDLGRLRDDDSRFSSYDFKPLLEAVSGGHWPGRDEVFVLLGATMIEAAPPSTPSVRAIAMAPDRYADRGVTVVGRFRGRNLYGDLPSPLNRTQWDFVLQSADAAVWISGKRPRGKGFDLDPGAKADTGRWLQVTGTVHREGVRVWIDAESLDLSSAPTETTVDVVVPPIVREPAPQVIFSAPLADEVDVDRARSVRVQFSRDMDPRSFRDHVRVSYATPDPAAAPALPPVTVAYHEGNRSLEIRFGKPLDRFQKVKVELIEGITAVDGQALAPWALVFTTGS